jgi:hypothetical protein
MNVQRYVIGSIVVFVCLVILEWLFHAVILSGWYNESRYLLRPEDERTWHAIWMFLGFLILAFGFCFIFTKGYENKGIGEGIRFGLYVGFAFAVSTSLIEFSVYPFPWNWIVAWIIGYPIIMMILGAVIAAIYQPKQA